MPFVLLRLWPERNFAAPKICKLGESIPGFFFLKPAK
jgi:hypothetical protein